MTHPPRRSTRHPVPHVAKHARDRMIDAHGRDLRPDEWARVVSAIQGGRAMALSIATRDGYVAYAFEVSGIAARFIWIPEREEIVTVLRPGMGNHKKVDAYASRPTKRRGDRMPTHFSRGSRLKGRTVWDQGVDPGKGSREAAIDTQDDEG